MDWFERLTGFRETGWDATRARLSLEGGHLVSAANGARWRVGTLELASLAGLRGRSAALAAGAGDRPRVRLRQADVRALHRAPDCTGALFQVASQFNLLEMIAPTVTPEDGVTRYEDDHTQGPACAIAAGAATLYRQYFVPVAGAEGQTASRQLDTLADLGAALAAALGRPPASLWTMRNGYALPGADGLAAVEAHLARLDHAGLDALRACLRIGLHWSVEVTDGVAAPGPLVSQALCSALPVAYSGLPPSAWARFGPLVLEAAYEATLLAALLHPAHGGRRTVLLTQLGGGAFGNPAAWIEGAMRRALERLRGHALEVVIVSHGASAAWLQRLARDWH